MRQDRERRIRALECAYRQKHDPPKLEVIRPGDGWVRLKWGDWVSKPILEDLYDAI